MRDLTEDELLQAIRTANIGGNTIRLTYDSGPYEVTRPTTVAEALARAITHKFYEVNNIGTPGVMASEPCPRGADKPEPTCTNRHQCCEPCGELGHSEEHVRVGRQSTAGVKGTGGDHA